MRWVKENESLYNMDVNSMFIDGGSGGAKMVSLAAITNENYLTSDNPSLSSTEIAYEQTHNNWDLKDSTPGFK